MLHILHHFLLENLDSRGQICATTRETTTSMLLVPTGAPTFSKHPRMDTTTEAVLRLLTNASSLFPAAVHSAKTIMWPALGGVQNPHGDGLSLQSLQSWPMAWGGGDDGWKIRCGKGRILARVTFLFLGMLAVSTNDAHGEGDANLTLLVG